MIVVGDNGVSIACKGTVGKLVIVIILFYYPQTEVGIFPDNISRAGQQFHE